MSILENSLSNSNDVEVSNQTTNSLAEEQTSFLETTLGQIINNALEVGIKAVLPEWLEDEFIEIKDEILNDGFKAGVEMAIEKAIEMGKAIQGIFTGEFENLSQIKSVIQSGGLLDTISDLLDSVISWAKEKEIINSSTAKLIKTSKNTIIENIESSIDSSLEDQVTAIEKIESYIEKWTEYYKEQDLTNMKKIYTRITNQLENIVPIQNVLEKVEQLENLHELIVNNGGDFNLTEEEIELSTMLVY